MPGDEPFEISLKNNLSEIKRFQSEFAQFALAQGLDTRTIQELHVLFEDLLANIVLYAYTDKEDHDIEVEIDASTERMKITVTDDGLSFNPLEAERPDTSLALEYREIGGLGIHLVLSMVDEVTYLRTEDQNVVVLIKSLSDHFHSN